MSKSSNTFCLDGRGQKHSCIRPFSSLQGLSFLKDNDWHHCWNDLSGNSRGTEAVFSENTAQCSDCLLQKLLGEKSRIDRLRYSRGGEKIKENRASEKECRGLLHHLGMLQSYNKNKILFLSVTWILDFYYACWQPACKLQKSLLGKALDRDLYRRGEMVKDMKKATKVLSRKYSTDWLA